MKIRTLSFYIILSVLILMTKVAVTVSAQDPLDSWARRIVPGLASNLTAVAFGNGAFVAVGEGSVVARSTDGLNWTVTTAGNYGNLAGVRFLNGQFVAVGSTAKMILSMDGVSWNETTLPGAGNWDVAYGNGTYVVGGTPALVSTNGTDWSTTTPRINVPGFGTIAPQLDSVVFGNGRFVALPVGSTITGSRLHGVYSTNGIDWLEGGNAPTTRGRGTGDLLFEGGLFVGVGSVVSGAAGSVSSDGATWCCGFGFGGSLSTDRGVALAFGEGYFLWVQQPFPTPSAQWPLIYTSTNASAWVPRFVPQLPAPLPSDPLYPYYQTMIGQASGAAFGNGTFVIVGEAGYIVQSGNIGGAPLILQQPQDRSAIADNPASFAVQVSGASPLFYQWFHDGVAILTATNASYNIPNVVPTDSGGYQVIITNSVGSVTSRVAQLAVSFLNIKSYAGIEILGVVGHTYKIDATAVNGAVNWQTLTNLVLPTSPYIWIDYDSPQAGQRLYRAAELP